MSDYLPISCANYDQFEIAILHGQNMRITWRDDQALVHVEVLRPCDLQTRAGEEFLLADTLSGQRIELRLDRIVRAESTDRP
jgi:transcriptional antiterminator Rof (Rho-off)